MKIFKDYFSEVRILFEIHRFAYAERSEMSSAYRLHKNNMIEYFYVKGVYGNR